MSEKNYTQPPTSAFNDEEESSFDAMEWIGLFLRNWYLLVVGLVVGLALAYYQNRSWTAQYVTEMKLMIDDNSANQYNFMQGFSAGGGYRSNNNQLFLIHSYAMMRRTVESLNMNLECYTRGRFKTTSYYGREPISIATDYLDPQIFNYEFELTTDDAQHFTISTTIDDELVEIHGQFGVPFEHRLMFATISQNAQIDYTPKFFFRFRSIASLEEEFMGRLSVGWIDEAATVLTASLVSNNPARDVDFLNKLGEKFIESNLEKKNAEAIRTIDFIDSQLDNIAESLSESEGRLRAFRRENNIIDVNSYTSEIAARVSELDGQRIALDQKERYFNYLSNYLKDNIVEDVLVAPTSIGVSDPTLLDLVSQYNKLQLDRSELGTKNPNYDRLTSQMKQVRNMLLEVLRNVRAVYDLDRANYEEQYKRAIAQTHDLPAKEAAIINMERDYKINDTYYTFLLQKRSEAQIRKASNVPDNSVLQEARVGGLVNSGTQKRTYTMFAFIGLLIPAAFIVLRRLLNFTIRTQKDISKILKTFPLIGSIRHTKLIENSPVLSIRNPKSAFTESLRSVRNRIEAVAQRKIGISVLITSSESGDGKTYFSINLAGVYGLISRKTLLIDLDLRKPSVSKHLNLKHKGLVHYLIGDTTLDEVIITDQNFGFDILLGGIIPPNPGELIRSEAMINLLNELKRRYDYIIIDTSPIGLVADAYSLTNEVDANLLIIRSNKTNKAQFKSFAERLKGDNIKNAYIVMNDVDAKKLGEYGYTNSYGYGYYNYYNKKKDNYYTETDFEIDES